ncbi:polyprenyl synthetase family protein [uncultured Succinatimonas sp.]|uniref:polyprenyl synthetase family protein n=1 Tax=uncultured Succinatimonas sp. TaxID=1262973 RepID=UPI0025D13CE4|nr:polyprenyl synthetase family protein [uncultured Succinatimonas sp.]
MALFEALIGSEMKKVEATLVEGFSDSDLEAHVNSLCLSIINAGGKRMRPALVLLAAHLLPTYTDEEEIAVCKLAAGVELLHTATLIHDDVIDNSLMRRGHPTLNSTSGNHVAVLAGDYMFTRCFATIKDLKKADVLNIISDTLATLVTGELDQLKNEGDVNISVEDYYTTIYCKTGALFELSASAPAVYLGEEEKYITALKNYGRYIGNAFQIIDDCLDYSSDSKTLGKNAGEDLQDKRITLPVIFALQRCSEAEKEILIKAIENADLETVISYINKYDTLKECKKAAEQSGEQAVKELNVFPENEYKQALISLVQRALNRKN